MFFPKTHYIYKVVDRNGIEDLLDVTTIDDIPCKWIQCHLIRTYAE